MLNLNQSWDFMNHVNPCESPLKLFPYPDSGPKAQAEQNPNPPKGTLLRNTKRSLKGMWNKPGNALVIIEMFIERT